MSKFFVLLVFFLLAGCASMNHSNKQVNNQPDTDNKAENVYWVNSWQRTCQGVGERMCLQVQKIDANSKQNPALDAWQLFYAPIEGFDYTLGYVYHIRVKETKLPAVQVPADASSIHYELVELLDKTTDETIRLYDIWALTGLNGQNVEIPTPLKSRQQQPSLEFNLSKMQVFGSDGCNEFFGPLNVLGQGHLQLGPLLSTSMACQDMMKQADDFHNAMNKVAHYELSGLTLRLLDADKQTLLQFKKVD